MAQSDEQAKILAILKNKYKALHSLQQLIEETQICHHLSFEKAPCPDLEKDHSIYFSKLLALFALTHTFYVCLGKLVQDNDCPLFEGLKELIDLSGEINERRRIATDEIAALKDNPQYDSLRDNIGANKIQTLLHGLKNADDLLEDLKSFALTGTHINQTLKQIQIKTSLRKFERAQQELIQTEQVFHDHMTSLFDLDKAYNIQDKCKIYRYHNIRLFFDLCKNLSEYSNKMLTYFKQTTTQPDILSKEDTYKTLKEYYVVMQQCAHLKYKIDKHELNRFQQDKEIVIKFLKCGLVDLHKSGLSSFLIMPLQHSCRYPILLKEIVSALPSEATEHQTSQRSCPDYTTARYCYDWLYQASQKLIAENNEAQRQYENALAKQTWSVQPQKRPKSLHYFFTLRHSLPVLPKMPPPLPPRNNERPQSYCPQASLKQPREEVAPLTPMRPQKRFKNAGRPLPNPLRYQKAKI